MEQPTAIIAYGSLINPKELTKIEHLYSGATPCLGKRLPTQLYPRAQLAQSCG